MTYVLKGSDGAIEGVSQTEVSEPGWQKVDAGSKELLAYFERAIKKQDRFRESDIQLARVLEDLIALLTERDYIKFTDFPVAAQKRLIERQTMRSKIGSLDLLDEDDDSF